MEPVLLVTNIFPPHAGGPATFIDLLAHALAARNFPVTVVCASDQPAEPTDASRPFRVRRLYWPARYRFEVLVRLVLFREMARHRRILVNGLEGVAGPIARVLRRRYVLKLVGDSVWERARNLGATDLAPDDFQEQRNGDPRWQSLAAERARYVGQAGHVIVPSRYLERLALTWGVPATKLTVVPNGTDVSLNGTGLVTRSDALRILFVGRLTNWKGVETLLLAVRELAGVEAVLCGDGPELPLLQGLADQLGLAGRVTFLGRRPRAEVLGEMKRAHVLVLTSLYEGMSHTILDALASGLPCVVSRCGGNEELVSDEVEGLLVPARDPQALRAALERLRDDEALRLRMAADARRRARGFDFQTTVSRYVEMLTNGHA